jgi:hypothetical protein
MIGLLFRAVVFCAAAAAWVAALRQGGGWWVAALPLTALVPLAWALQVEVRRYSYVQDEDGEWVEVRRPDRRTPPNEEAPWDRL